MAMQRVRKARRKLGRGLLTRTFFFVVLLAIGRPHEVAHGSLRLTLNEENTQADVDEILRAVPQVVGYLREISPVWDELQKGEKQYVIQ